jgi:hypothetical protein
MIFAGYATEDRWYRGGFPLGASIFCLLGFGALALVCAYSFANPSY